MEDDVVEFKAIRYSDKEMIGRSFGLWTVVDTTNQCGKLLARCECGLERVIGSSELQARRVNSCFACAKRRIRKMYGSPANRVAKVREPSTLD